MEFIKRFYDDISFSACIAGLIAVIVSFAGPGLVILEAANVSGMNVHLLSSWFFSISVASGIAGLILSLVLRTPIICAWSTPGAALLVTSLSGYSYKEAIGAFLISSLLIFLSGITGVFEKLMNKVPKEITSALLAGILLNFGIKLFSAAELNLSAFLVIFIVYLLLKKHAPMYSALGALFVSILFSFNQVSIPNHIISFNEPIFTLPVFTWSSFIGLSLPLFIVTMASQNAPGVSVLKSSGYENAPISTIISTTGLFSAVFSLFGSHAINLAAITAAFCTSDNAHRDVNKRYISGVVCGVCYIGVGIFGAGIIQMLFSLPGYILSILAGLSLLPSISLGIRQSFTSGDNLDAALVTLLTAASGLTIFGVGSAFWALFLGVSVKFIFNMGKMKLNKLWNVKYES